MSYSGYTVMKSVFRDVLKVFCFFFLLWGSNLLLFSVFFCDFFWFSTTRGRQLWVRSLVIWGKKVIFFCIKLFWLIPYMKYLVLVNKANFLSFKKIFECFREKEEELSFAKTASWYQSRMWWRGYKSWCGWQGCRYRRLFTR